MERSLQIIPEKNTFDVDDVTAWRQKSAFYIHV